jgi:hypothetical protein
LVAGHLYVRQQIVPRLVFETLWVDGDGMLSVSVTASNDQHSHCLETFIYPQTLLEFGGNLENFPVSPEQEVALEAGSSDPQWHDHFQLRAFMLDAAGHSALEIWMDARGAPPVKASSRFYLACNPADLNALGAVLRKWAGDPQSVMSFEWREGL